MKRCPITYEKIDNNEWYSKRGLYLLSPSLKNLHPLDFTATELRLEAISRVGKMSIQGIQAKLSAQLKIKAEHFELVDQYGHYILKPQSEYYSELPENEAITMSLARIIGLNVPVHGMIYTKDKNMTYFVKRFDRAGHNKKFAVEDFAQLLGLPRDSKYNSSMEKVATVVLNYCSFPVVEFVKLLKLTLFSFLVGNEDMHLKNFSLITQDQKIMLSPVYDLLNTSIAMSNPEEELALSLNGKKRNLTKKDLLGYFALERLGLNNVVVEKVMQDFKKAIPIWREMICNSFLSQAMQQKYLKLLNERWIRLD